MNAINKPDANQSAIAARSAKHHLRIGEITTCQFGNPGDTNWDAATHGNVQVEILDIVKCPITKRDYFLVKKVGQEYVGRASAWHYNPNDEFDEPKLGALYCTTARTYGAIAQTWTGIRTLEDARHSLGF
jgi:hypothetical protein